MPKIILVTGIYRSGTTWVFNIVRSLCVNAHLDFKSLYSDKLTPIIIEEIDKKKIVIIKAHTPDKNIVSMADLILCCYRKPEDAINSFTKSFNTPIKSSQASIFKACTNLMQLKKEVIYFKYESLFFNKPITVKKISLSMNLETTNYETIFNAHTKEKVIQEISLFGSKNQEFIDSPLEIFTPETLWHFNHTRNYGHKKLTFKETFYIFIKFKFFYKSKYPLFFYLFESVYYANKIKCFLIRRIKRLRQINSS